MNQKLHQDQNGIAHVLVIGLIVAVVAAVGVVGWRVAHDRSDKKSVTAAAASSVAAKSAVAATPAPAATATKTTPTTTTTKAPTVKTPVASAPAASVPPAAPATVSVVPAGYTNLGTISSDSLYNVKSPPSSTEQPTMTLYACMKTTGNKTGYVQTLGTLSYPVPHDAGSAWYINLDLSSSASADNVVSDKSSTQSYQNNTWQSSGAPSGMVNESSAITSTTINPGVVTDYYVWASGSYGGSTWQTINNHLNVTQLASCN